MINIIKQFMMTGFEPGDFTYGLVHIGSIALMVASIPILILIYLSKPKERIIRDAKTLAWITLLFYIVRRGVDVYQGKPFLEAFWPFYLCNVNTVFLSLYLIFNIKKGRDFFLITGMSGAILMFVVPEGVFNDRFLTLQIFESLLSHYFIFIVPIVFLATRTHELNLRQSWHSILGFLLVLFNVEVLQELLTSRYVDYLFLQGPINLSIFGIPQVYIMFVLALVYVYTIYIINYAALGKIRFDNGIVLQHELKG